MATHLSTFVFRISQIGLLIGGLMALVAVVAMLRLASVTDYLHHSRDKDPERHAPAGRLMVAPADGTVLYVRRVRDGMIPQVVKRGVPVPVAEHLKVAPERPFRSGWLIGIYMNTQGVHVNRMPDNGRVRRQTIFNGPHMNMTEVETTVILTQLVPGLVTLKKLLGMEPYAIEDDADFVLKSARETLTVEDERGTFFYVVRIADFYVGKILTWVAEDEVVARGQKIGLITWGSQTDLFIEDGDGISMTVDVGDYVYGGETVVATY